MLLSTGPLALRTRNVKRPSYSETDTEPGKATFNIWAKEPRLGCAARGLPSWPVFQGFGAKRGFGVLVLEVWGLEVIFSGIRGLLWAAEGF